MGVVKISVAARLPGAWHRRHRGDAAYPSWFYLPAAIVFAALFLTPAAASLFFSLTRWTLFDFQFVGLENFVQFFREPFLFQGLINTFIYGFLTSGAKVVLGLMVLIQLAYGLPFTVLLFQSFFSTIPRELDDAAIIDGAGPLRIFFGVMLPLLRPVVVTVIVVQSVAVFNDFTDPLYYLPGNESVTVQLSLFNFNSQFSTQFNLLFANILLITIPPLVVFLFFNRQIVAGMTAGAVKG